MSTKTWAVILSLCTKDSSGNNQSYFTVRETFSENHYTSEQSLVRDMIKFAKQGVGLIVRPQFNDNERGDFHEWRSFDGAPFHRVEFGSPVKVKPTEKDSPLDHPETLHEIE